MDEFSDLRRCQARYHIATDTWSLVAHSGAVKTLSNSKMRMLLQRFYKAHQPELIQSELRRRALEKMAEIKDEQRPSNGGNRSGSRSKGARA